MDPMTYPEALIAYNIYCDGKREIEEVPLDFISWWELEELAREEQEGLD